MLSLFDAFGLPVADGLLLILPGLYDALQNTYWVQGRYSKAGQELAFSAKHMQKCAEQVSGAVFSLFLLWLTGGRTIARDVAGGK